MNLPARFHPIGTPGQPWGAAEKAQWRAQQRVRRRYVDDVGVVIEGLRERLLGDRDSLGARNRGRAAPILATAPASRQQQQHRKQQG